MTQIPSNPANGIVACPLALPPLPPSTHRIALGDKLYIFSPVSNHTEVYTLNMQTGQTHKLELNNNDQEEGTCCISSDMVSIVVDQVIYFCGPKPTQPEDLKLVGFNWVNLQWHQYPQIEREENEKGEDFRDSTLALISFKNLYLVLLHISPTKESENVWIYDLNQEFWEKSNNLLIPQISNPRICHIQKRIFILGDSPKEREQALITEIVMELQEEAEGFPISFKDSQFQLDLQKMSELGAGFLAPFTHEQLILFPKSVDAPCFWLYDVLSEVWTCIDCQMPKRSENHEYSHSPQGLLLMDSQGGRFVLKKGDDFEKLLNDIRFKSESTCEICYEVQHNKNELMEAAFKISKQMMKQLTDNIEFPFAAIGLLADNCLNYSASTMNIQYNSHKGQPYLRVEDDAKLTLSNEELEQILVNFEAMTNFNYSSVERRVRTILTKEFHRKQFGTNIKLASMRLGSEMLYISINNLLDVRVAYFAQEQDEYVCYYYVEDMKTKRLHEEYSLETRCLVENRYGDLMLSSLHSDESQKYPPFKNTLFIFGLQEVEDEEGNLCSELQPQDGVEKSEDADDEPKIDILNVSQNRSLYEQLKSGSMIQDSLDVSLCSYLKSLYLKNQHLKITIQIQNGPRRPVSSFNKYRSLDRMVWQKSISSIDSTISQFDFRNQELFANNSLGRKIGVWHNGVLLYVRNRLVGRFGECRLGQLLNFLALVESPTFNYFEIFGFVELPESLETNQTKTQFVHPMMLEKFKSRMNFVSEWFKSNFVLKENQKNVILKEGTKLRSRVIEIEEELQPQGLPSKRHKRNPEDQSQ